MSKETLLKLLLLCDRHEANLKLVFSKYLAMINSGYKESECVWFLEDEIQEGNCV